MVSLILHIIKNKKTISLTKVYLFINDFYDYRIVSLNNEQTLPYHSIIFYNTHIRSTRAYINFWPDDK